MMPSFTSGDWEHREIIFAGDRYGWLDINRCPMTIGEGRSDLIQGVAHLGDASSIVSGLVPSPTAILLVGKDARQIQTLTKPTTGIAIKRRNRPA
jgi:hypothetical protein